MIPQGNGCALPGPDPETHNCIICALPPPRQAHKGVALSVIAAFGTDYIFSLSIDIDVSVAGHVLPSHAPFKFLSVLGSMNFQTGLSS